MVEVGELSETFDLYPPKAEVRGSNPFGRATRNVLKLLNPRSRPRTTLRTAGTTLSISTA